MGRFYHVSVPTTTKPEALGSCTYCSLLNTLFVVTRKLCEDKHPILTHFFFELGSTPDKWEIDVNVMYFFGIIFEKDGF